MSVWQTRLAVSAAVSGLVAVVTHVPTGMASAQPPPAAQVALNARAVVSATVYRASATEAAFERVADERLLSQRKEIEALRVQGAQAQAEAARKMDEFVAQIAERDLAYSRAIAVFRGEVENIALTPQGMEALQRFNSGDWAGARTILRRLIEVNDRAVDLRARIQRATPRRQMAALSIEAYREGVETLENVVGLFREITALDDGSAPDWLQLARFTLEWGRLPEARQAASRALEVAANDLEKSTAQTSLAQVSGAQGNITEAERIIRDGLGLARKYAAERPEDPSGQTQLTASLGLLADTLVEAGKYGEARPLYNEALELARAGAAARPSDVGSQLDFVDLLRKVANSYWTAAETPTAHQYYEEAAAYAARLIADQPKVVAYRFAGAEFDAALGQLITLEGDVGRARPYFERSVATFREIAALNPDAVQIQHGLAEALKSLGGAMWTVGDVAGARGTNEEALKIHRDLAARDRTSVSSRMEVQETLGMVASVHQAMGLFDSAAGLYGESVDLARELARISAGSVTAQLRLFDALTLLSNLEGNLGRIDRARAHFLEAVEIGSGILASSETSFGSRAMVANNELRFGMFLITAADYPAALVHMERGLVLARQLAADDPTNIYVQRGLSDFLGSYGDALAHTGEFKKAQVLYEEAVAHSLRVASVDPNSELLRLSLAATFNRLGDALGEQGDFAGAEAQFAKALEQARGTARPNVNAYLPLTNLGFALIEQGRVQEALPKFEEALRMAQTLPGDANSAPAEVSLANVYLGLGQILYVQGDVAGARAKFEQLAATAKQYAVATPTVIPAHHGFILGMQRVALPKERWWSLFSALGVSWLEVVVALEELDAAGALGDPAARKLLEVARTQLKNQK